MTVTEALLQLQRELTYKQKQLNNSHDRIRELEEKVRKLEKRYDEYMQEYPFPPPNCVGCGRFIGKADLKSIKVSGHFDIPEWEPYHKACLEEGS